MKLSDLTTLTKLAIGLVVAGAVISLNFTSTINGVCSFVDYGKLVFGGLAAVVGALGTLSALRLTDTGRVNLLASGGACVLGILLALIGLGILGGPC